VLGVRVKMRPDLARRVTAEGHQIASHSWGHRDFAKSKPAEIKRQIRKSRAVIKAETGVDSRWIRAPYGSMNARAWKTVGKERMKVVGWNVDSGDWAKPGVKKIANGVVKRTRPGSIVLMHDGGGNRAQTVKALPLIIKQLRKKGYTFVTVEELYAVRAVAKDPKKK
jgi:peptidoglycan/xylan/chitin deacetylase (PgdA/CDA1 family)